MSKDSTKTHRTEGGFISRWSRRKAAVSEPSSDSADSFRGADTIHDEYPDAADPLQRSTLGSTESAGELTDHAAPDMQPEPGEEPRVLTDEDMPDIESMTNDDDYSGFLSPGVSEGLRKIALRKLFYGGKFSLRDGLDDYDDDFTNFPALGDLITCDMKHQQEMKEKRRLEAEEQEKRLQQEQEQEQQQLEANQQNDIDEQDAEPTEIENTESLEQADQENDHEQPEQSEIKT